MVSKKSAKKNARKGAIESKTSGGALGKDVHASIRKRVTQSISNNVQGGHHPRTRARPKKVKTPTPKRSIGTNKKNNASHIIQK